MLNFVVTKYKECECKSIKSIVWRYIYFEQSQKLQLRRMRFYRTSGVKLEGKGLPYDVKRVQVRLTYNYVIKQNYYLLGETSRKKVR